MARALKPERLVAWLVFWSGPVAWFLQQLVLYQLTLPTCHGKPWLSPVVGAVFLLIPGASIAYSARTLFGPLARETTTPVRHFVLMVGGIATVIFLVAMVWQEIATFAYTGCER
jgi:hypothetical protein